MHQTSIKLQHVHYAKFIFRCINIRVIYFAALDRQGIRPTSMAVPPEDGSTALVMGLYKYISTSEISFGRSGISYLNILINSDPNRTAHQFLLINQSVLGKLSIIESCSCVGISYI